MIGSVAEPGTGGRQHRPVRWAFPAACAALALTGCATAPDVTEGYSIELPAGVIDGRARFRDIFCAVLREHGASLPDDRSCESALSPVRDDPSGTNRPVRLDASRRHLVAAAVAGVGYACLEPWLDLPDTAVRHLREYEYDLVRVEVDALSGIEVNGRQVRDAILARPEESGPARLVLIGYSKGAPDILEAIVRYPEIRSRIAAVVSLAGAIDGSPLADDGRQWEVDLFRHWPGATCERGDGQAVESLRPAVRREWWSENTLPAGIPYYSVVTLPAPDRISRLLEVTYHRLGRIDWRNDGQMLSGDQFVPHSTLLGFLNADHWAVAVPIARSHPTIAAMAVNHNDYPREALLEAVLRYVDEDLDRRR